MSISVIIPVYNRADLIGATLDSALEQTLPADEILVIDDGSTDQTAAVVKQYVQDSSGKVKFITQANAGPSAARNRGLAQARGSYIAFLDADDLWLPTKLAQQIDLLNMHPEASGVYCRMFQFRKELDDMHRRQLDNQTDIPSGLAGVEYILQSMCIQSSTAMVRRSLVEGLKFDESITAAEDALYFAQAAQRGHWLRLDQALVGYRVHTQQLTKQAWHAVKHTQARVNWCRAHAGELGAQTMQTWEDRLWERLVKQVEKQYWKRQLDDLPALRDKLLELCPRHMQKSFLTRRILWPRWVYRLRDAVSGSRGK